MLDCSYAMSWVFDDEKEERADALLAQLREQNSLVVPAVLWGLEVANCLHGARQRGRLTASQAEVKRGGLQALPIIEMIPPHGLSRACFDLSAKAGLTSYDVAYLGVGHRGEAAPRDERPSAGARGSRCWRRIVGEGRSTIPRMRFHFAVWGWSEADGVRSEGFQDETRAQTISSSPKSWPRKPNATAFTGTLSERLELCRAAHRQASWASTTASGLKPDD